MCRQALNDRLDERIKGSVSFFLTRKMTPTPLLTPLLTPLFGPDGSIETTLSGQLADQAALTGVLNTPYELHLPVLSVECVGCKTLNESSNGH